MRMSCNGNHRLLVPIRPIALTFCDAVGLARHSKLWSGALLLIAVGLLFTAHLSAAQIEGLTHRFVQLLVSKYVTGLTAEWAYTLVLHWMLANAAFFAFRLGAAAVLYVAYELGRDAVFALLCLAAILLGLYFAAAHVRPGAGAAIERQASVMLGAVWVLGWYWSRYLSPRNPNRRVFDHDVGAARARLRQR